jgi:hypothetical protein
MKTFRRALIRVVTMLVTTLVVGTTLAAEQPAVAEREPFVLITTSTGERVEGQIVGCSLAGLVIHTKLGDLTLDFGQVARIDFGSGPMPATDPMASLGLPGYALVTDAPSPPLPKELRVFLVYGPDAAARHNATSHFLKLSSKRAYREREIRITDSAHEANILLLRVLGSDVRSEVRSDTYTHTYLDIFQGGLRQAPATSVYTVSTVDVLSAILYVDHQTKKVFVAFNDVARAPTNSGHKSGTAIIEKLFELIR